MKIKMDLSEELTVTNAFTKFERQCKLKNLADNTIKSYREKFKVFSQYVDGARPIREIDETEVENFVLWLKEKGDKATSINSYLRTIRAVLNYIAGCGLMDSIEIKLLKVEKEVKETYTETELKRLLKKPNLRKTSFNEYKIWVLENYLLGTGNRISTALEIKIGDIDFDGAVIILKKTKNRKQQIVPLSSTLIQILAEYIQIRKGKEEDYLFCNSWGKKANTRTIQQMVADYNKARGVSKTSCHLFRHSYAKMYILNGGDAFRLQKLLGHSSLAITKEYVTMFGSDLSLNYDNLNPLEQFSMARQQRISMNDR